jgi:hypothetical protein
LIQTTGGNGSVGYWRITPSASTNGSFYKLASPDVCANGDIEGEVDNNGSQWSVTSTGRGVLAAYSKEDDLVGRVFVPLIESINLKASQVEIPPRLVGVLGRDYFMDFITQKSHIRECPSPLALVARGSTEGLGLQAVLGQDGERKLTNYAAQIESGYPTTGYHCQRHAADVSNRIVALLVRTGIAQPQNKPDDAPWTLAALAAAMMHDYDHPHLNNQYLVAMVSPHIQLVLHASVMDSIINDILKENCSST